MPELDDFQILLGARSRQSGPAAAGGSDCILRSPTSKGRPCSTTSASKFLGDAVLQLVLTRDVFTAGSLVPAKDHSPRLNAKLVNRRALADKGRRLQIGPHLKLSRGEDAHGGRERASTLADAFESMLGAIFHGWRIPCRGEIRRPTHFKDDFVVDSAIS